MLLKPGPCNSVLFQRILQLLGYYLKLGHEHFLPHPVKFIINYSFNHLILYSLSYLQLY
jgi:hypothetical protein